MPAREYVLLEEVALDKCYYSVPGSLQQTQFLQNMLDDFNIITTSPYLPTNAVLKTNIPF